MKRLLNFATNHPLLFVLLGIVAWILLGALSVMVAVTVLNAPINDLLVQSIGLLFATACFLALAWRWDWLKPAGFTRLGGVSLWLVTLAVAIFSIIAYQLAMFGEIALSFAQINSPDARQILLRQAVVGFTEESMFRGILLFALVRVWGGSSRGTLAAIGVTALLFGALHSLQVVAGSDGPQLVFTIVNCIVAGLLLGALVLWGGSIWPAVLLHAVSNASVQIASLNGIDITTNGLALATLTDLALVFVFGALLLHRRPSGISSHAVSSPTMPKPEQKWELTV